MFENYKFHGLYIAIQAVLTLYAQGICLFAWVVDSFAADSDICEHVKLLELSEC